MRSLTLSSCRSSTVQGKKAEARYTALAVRPEELLTTQDNETLYIASERQLPDGGVEIQVFIGNSTEPSSTNTAIASFQAPPEPPFELPDGKHIVNLRYLAESVSLVIVLAGGDIVVISLEEELLPDQEKVEVVGSVESGIKAAAWSPDEELLVLVTGEDNLVEMTKTFDVLQECPVKTEDFGENEFVNVGWGDQTTQFHGSIGKAGRDAVAGLPAASALTEKMAMGSANATVPSTSAVERPLDTTIRISWRGDGAFFVVTTLFDVPRSNEKQRRLRFYSRTAVLQSTSEATPALEGSLAWQPSGSIIASSANDATQVVFFERNGLRRYEFSLKEEKPEYGSIVRQLAWNADSSILAVWIERTRVQHFEKKHVVQLWRRNNYHWYLKQSIRPALSSDSDMERIFWNPEESLVLYFVSSSGCEKRLFEWDTYTSRRSAPHDSGAVAVVDGAKLLFTPFRYQNVPPPMSSLELNDPTGHTPVHVAFSAVDDVLATLMPDGAINIWTWTFAKANKSTLKHLGRLEGSSSNATTIPRQLAIHARGRGSYDLHTLQWKYDAEYEMGMDQICTISICIPDERPPQMVSKSTKPLSNAMLSLRGTRHGTYLQTAQHRLVTVESEAEVARFPEICPDWDALNTSTFVGLSASGRLFVNQRTLATACSSFAIGGEFLVYTTLAHEARFVLIDTLVNAQGNDEDHLKDDDVHIHPVRQDKTQGSESAQDNGYQRKVERGSRIVTVVPSSMSVVLQMPRGNLETICPRPLVLQVVRSHLDQQEYREAFLICRRHRIDLNILCDHNFETFKRDLPLFVEQIADTDYLNLFISGLKNEDITKTLYKSLTVRKSASDARAPHNKVNDLCAALRNQLESKDILFYANSILTTYVCQQPSDLESALQLILKLKALDAEQADDAVKYTIFLADANKLFDVALGMYDFELVLAVAQHSQKDPREYIPFLGDLRTYEAYIQRYKIDDHLKLYSKALKNLSLAGDEHFVTALDYIKLHELYDDAVTAYSSQPEKLQTVLDIRGDWLMRDNRAHEAAISYTLAKKPRKAMVAHQKALTWVELFDIALQEKLTAEEIGQLAEHVSDGLRGKARHAEAGRILLEYGRDVKGAIDVLSEGGEFAEALRIANLYSAAQLVPEIIVPNAIIAKSKLCDEADEILEQLEKQVERLAVLREKRVTDSATFYGRLLPSNGDEALENVDMQTDAGASTVATTQFTRYTAAAPSTFGGTVKTGKTKRSSKTDRKQMRKAAGGAKGSIFEESYLLGSLSRMVADKGRLHVLITATASLTRVLVRLSTMPNATEGLEDDTVFLQEAKSLEDTVDDVVQKVAKAIDDTWEALGDAKLHDLETALLADADPTAENVEILKRPEKPKVASFGHWKVPVLDLLNV